MEDITAEYPAEQLAPPIELHTRIATTVAAKTDLGCVRENNEDKFEFFIPEVDSELAAKGHIYLVCDGMGGHNAGQFASELTCKTFIDVYRNHPSSLVDVAATSATLAANRFVRDVGLAVPSRRNMGTTLTGLLLVQDKGYIVQVGDSRLYRMRNGETAQLTRDHTWVEDVVSQGMMTREEAEQHPYKHVITKAIGPDGDPTPDIIPIDLALDDVFLLCSDGLSNHVKIERIHEVLSQHAPSMACWQLVNDALADGGSDNCTALIVRIDGLSPA